ncbi:hypothetical protein I7I52_09234 [Histoplasma capsulatum]|uniref:Uncharacterized protein n=1 Tax=Ajellomyces capsulatus TaxID=5037 RepID=A0A8H8D296_AJECA|nr:hypothetical protein I7I52_09234 [Histoplasma capsulatum]
MARVLSAELILISKFDASLIVRLAKPRASLLYIFRFWGFFFFFFFPGCYSTLLSFAFMSMQRSNWPLFGMDCKIFISTLPCR